MRHLIILLGLLLIPSAASAQDVSPRCEAAMDRAAGHYSQCLLSADASYARHGNATKLENRQTRCETRFDRRTSRAIHRHGEDECPSSDLVAAMEDRTVTYAQGAATEASGTASPSFLFVQNGTGGTLSDTTLTLTGVSSKTGYFSDRPYRLAGQVPTEESHHGLGRSRELLNRGPAERRLYVHGRWQRDELRRGIDFARHGGRGSLLFRQCRGGHRSPGKRRSRVKPTPYC